MIPLLANQPPAPQMFIAMLAILPLMALLTRVSGGYGIMKEKAAQGGRKALGAGCTIALVTGLVVLSGMQEGIGLLVTVFFSLHALIRGLWLLQCGVRGLRPEKERPSWLSGAAPARLIPAGVLTSALAVLAGGAAFAFLGFWPFESFAANDLRRLVALEIAGGRVAAGPDGAPRYPDPVTRTADGREVLGRPGVHEVRRSWGGGFGSFAYFDVEARAAPDGRSFTIRATPSHYPFAPYNHLVTLPAFYADETGKVRSIPCRASGRPCPPDAPIAFEVLEPEIEEWVKRIREAEAPRPPR